MATSWSVILCDRSGNAIANISSIARGKSFNFALNAPSSFTFVVPSDHTFISTKHTDSNPFLSEQVRVIKAYRQEYNASGQVVNVIRFAGYVDSISDEGGTEACYSHVVCVDPFGYLSQRFVREIDSSGTGTLSTGPDNYDFQIGATSALSAGVTLPVATIPVGTITGFASSGTVMIGNSQIVTYTGISGSTLTGATGGTGTFVAGDAVIQGPRSTSLAQYLITRANATSSTGITTSGGRLDTTDINGNPMPFVAPRYTYKKIGDALNDIMNAYPGPEIYVEPIDTTTGNHGRIHIANQYGGNQPEAIWAWGMAPHNVTSITRAKTSTDLANHMIVVGGNATVYEATGTTTGAYGLHEDTTSYTDISNTALLKALGDEEVSLRQNPREEVTMTPLRGKHPLPWTDFWLGDYVTVWVGARLRGGFTGQMRVYGLQIDVDDDGGENVASITTKTS